MVAIHLQKFCEWWYSSLL